MGPFKYKSICGPSSLLFSSDSQFGKPYSSTLTKHNAINDLAHSASRGNLAAGHLNGIKGFAKALVSRHNSCDKHHS